MDHMFSRKGSASSHSSYLVNQYLYINRELKKRKEDKLWLLGKTESSDSWRPSREKEGLIGISYLPGLDSGDE